MQMIILQAISQIGHKFLEAAKLHLKLFVFGLNNKMNIVSSAYLEAGEAYEFKFANSALSGLKSKLFLKKKRLDTDEIVLIDETLIIMPTAELACENVYWSVVCGLVVRVPGYRSRCPGSIRSTITFSPRSGVRSVSWVQLRSYLRERVVAPV
jgi:hypothetical protein